MYLKGRAWESSKSGWSSNEDRYRWNSPALSSAIGVCVHSMLSQFGGEEEVLFPPCCLLVVKDPQRTAPKRQAICRGRGAAESRHLYYERRMYNSTHNGLIAN